MRWKGRRRSDNVVDQRGMRSGDIQSCNTFS